MKMIKNPPFYVLYLLDDNMDDPKNVLSTLMLFSFDFEFATKIVECSYLFTREIIHSSDNRDEIMIMERIFNEYKVKVMVEKYE